MTDRKPRLRHDAGLFELAQVIGMKVDETHATQAERAKRAFAKAALQQDLDAPLIGSKP